MQCLLHFSDDNFCEIMESTAYRFFDYANYMDWEVSPLMCMMFECRARVTASENKLGKTEMMEFLDRSFADATEIVEALVAFFPPALRKTQMTMCRRSTMRKAPGISTWS